MAVTTAAAARITAAAAAENAPAALAPPKRKRPAEHPQVFFCAPQGGGVSRLRMHCPFAPVVDELPEQQSGGGPQGQQRAQADGGEVLQIGWLLSLIHI